MFRDDSLLTEEFYAVAGGYLSTNANDLPSMLRRLPCPVSARERAIKYAIEWGIENPYEWNKLQLGPRKLTRSPELAMRDQGFRYETLMRAA